MMTGVGMMSGWGWLGMLSMSLFWIAALALTIWGLTRAFTAPTARVEQDALEILKRRFADGEINQAEYEQARRAIMG